MTMLAQIRPAVFLAAVVVCLATAPAVRGSDHAAPAAGAHGGKEEPEEDDGSVNLGEFEIEDFQPTHKTIPRIRFAAYIVLDEKSTPTQRQEMTQWKQRLRDQAIIAVRGAESYALAEPGLERIQRLIYLRVRRLPLPAKAAGVYLTEFSVDEQD